MSEVMNNMWKYLGVQHLLTSVYHLQTNGLLDVL